MRLQTIRSAAVVLLLLAAGSTAALSSRELVTLEGTFAQGGLVFGRTDPRAAVEFEGRPVRVSPDGVFVIGFGRDAPPKATLRLRYPDGVEEVQELEVEQRDYDIQRLDGLPDRMVTPPPETWERIKADNRKIGKVRRIDTPETWFLSGWIWPAEGPISGVYGSQRILNGKPKQPHFGVDVAAPTGTPVIAPADGKVVLAETDMYYTGGTIFIDHGHGLTSAFLHMSAVDVEVGQFVRRGERIGAIGATGRVTGAHLDWRINWFSARIDPEFLVPPRRQRE